MSKDLVKMPMMPDLFRDAIPVRVPAMQYKSGLMKDIVHNMKLGRMAKDMKRRREIAEDQNAITKANLDTFHGVVTSGAQIQDTLDEYRHRHEVRREELKKLELENQKLTLENQILYYQAKNEEMDYQMKKREFDGAAQD